MRHFAAFVVMTIWIASPSRVIGAPIADDVKTAPVTCIAFAPDGNSVLVGSQAGVSVYSWPNLKRSAQFDTKLVNVHDLQFSPDGKRFAVAGGEPAQSGGVEVLSWPGGDSLTFLQSHSDSVLGIAWRSDIHLASASLDRDLILWDVSAGKEIRRFRGHSGGVTSVCFLPNGGHMVSAGLDQNLRVWNAETGELLRTLNNHKREIHELALRPNETGLPTVASVSGDRTMRLWQPTIGRMIRFAQLKTVPLSITWLPDGSLVAVAGTDGSVYWIDPDNVEIVHQNPAVAEWAYAVAAHPTDHSLAVGGRRGDLTRVVRPGQDAKGTDVK